MTYQQRLDAQLKQAEQKAVVSYPSGKQQVVDSNKCVWQHVGKHHG